MTIDEQRFKIERFRSREHRPAPAFEVWNVVSGVNRIGHRIEKNV